MLSFLAPWWAAGAVAAVGLPLLAHLLSRSRYRDVLFPATRFVRQATQETARLERPRSLLLMLLRGLLLLLVVAAFMRPSWLPPAEATQRGRGEALIILLDASASMRRSDTGATLYGRAMQRADAQLAGLAPSRDVAALVLVRQRAQPLLPEPTADLAQLRAALAATTPTYESADWSGAVAQTQRLAEAADGRRIRIVVISDQQGDGPAFKADNSALSRAAVEYKPISSPSDNTALRLIDTVPYPAVAGRPMTVTAELSHFGPAPRSVTLRASFGEAQAERRVLLQPGGQQIVELTLPGTAAGQVKDRSALRLSIDPADAQPADDTAGRFLAIATRTQVMILHGDGVASASIAAQLAQLINPGEVAGQPLPEVLAVPISQALPRVVGVQSATLRTIVLLDAGQVDRALGDALSAYMQSGGGVIAIVPDARRMPPADVLALPLQQTANRRYLVVDQPASAIDFSLTPLRVFEGPARAGLAALTWPGIDPATLPGDAEPLLMATNNRPIIAATTLGRGRLIALNTDLKPAPGGLLAEPAFVVLFNELCRYASPGPTLPPPARPGDPLPASLRSAAKLTTPDNADLAASTFTAPGPYSALNSAGQRIDGRWAELDPAESNPQVGRGWSADEAQADPRNAAASNSADPSTTSRDQPIELWPYLVIAALLIAAVESLALWRYQGTQGGAV